MKKVEIKERAQEEIMHMLANTLTSYQERNYKDETPEEAAAIEKEIQKQADRIAKIMGYEYAWHN